MNCSAQAFHFDAAGRLREIIDPIIELPDKFVKYDYNGVRLVTLVTDAKGIKTKFEYGVCPTPTDQGG